MTKVYLSPSAQPHNAYAGQGTNEQVQCNRIAEYARQALIKNGYEVKKAPEGQDFPVSIMESNAWCADIHIPIHTNAGGGRGCEEFAWSGSQTNKYVRAVYSAVGSVTTNPGRGIKTGNHLAEVASTSALCIYIECEFHDDPIIAKWIIDNVKVLGEAIARGVCDAEGKPYKPLDGQEKISPVMPSAPSGQRLPYRVRRSWSDTASQIGAFNILDNAINAAKDATPYKVFDATGKEVRFK